MLLLLRLVIGWLLPLALAAVFSLTALIQPPNEPVQANLSQPMPAFAGPVIINRRAPFDPPFTGIQQLDSARLGGQPVLLSFWASWSGLCSDESAMMQRVWNDYRGQGVLLVGVAVHDAQPNARAFIERNRLTFPTLIDTTLAIGQAFALSDIPERIFVSRSGTIVRRHVGAIDEPTLRRYLDELLR